jgi:hypothetical protein
MRIESRLASVLTHEAMLRTSESLIVIAVEKSPFLPMFETCPA